jgi:hypothetical protein
MSIQSRGRPRSTFSDTFLAHAQKDPSRWHLFAVETDTAKRVARKLRREQEAQARTWSLDEALSVLAVKSHSERQSLPLEDDHAYT